MKISNASLVNDERVIGLGNSSDGRNEDRLENGLANKWRMKKIRKTPHVDRGQTIKWEIPNDIARAGQPDGYISI
jgi:hypothetical protein